MNKEFVDYKTALALKELGFDEACFGLWNLNNGKHEVDIIGLCKYSKDFKYREVLAPTFSQAFRWMREKYDINNCISYSRLEDNNWYYQYYKSGLDGGFKTYEEAEQACLDKLIEIVKNNAHI